jgi:hypothetical protein
VQPGAADAVAFRFSPDFAELASKDAAFLERESVRWELAAESDSKNGRITSKKFRLGIGPVSVGGSASSKRTAVNHQLAEIVFSATGMSTVNIIPGGWFSGDSIDRFAKGPFKPGRGGEPWWGRNGRLGLYPKSLVVVSDPSFSLRLDARTYREVQAAIAGGASIAVGPFQIPSQIPSQGGKTAVTFDESHLTIRARIKSRAMIIAIINQVNGPS